MQSLPRRSPTSGGTFIYVTNTTTYRPPFIGSVLVYPVGSDGDATPAADIAGSNTGLGRVEGIAVSSSGEIYVSNADKHTVVGFASGSTGNVAPNIVIAGSETGLSYPNPLAFDRFGNLYVDNCGSCSGSGQDAIEVFAPGSSGNVAPLRTISGSMTGLGQIDGLAVGQSGEIYVANARESDVLVFGAREHGNVAPIRTIGGGRSRIYIPDSVAYYGLNLYVAAAYSGYVERFRRGDDGGPRPRAILNTQFPSAGPSGEILTGVVTAPDGTIYVSGLSPRIAQWAGDASGNDAPLTTIEGPHTGLIVPTDLVVK